MTTVVYGEDAEVYHANPAIGSSLAKKMMESPALFHAAIVDKNNGEQMKPTKAMLFGTLFHLALLEPTAYKKKYIELPKEITPKSADAKTYAKQAAVAGLEVLAPDDAKKIKGMLATMPERVRLALAEMDTEVVFRSESFGLQLQCRFDAISRDHTYGFDIKTIAQIKKIKWQVEDMRYYFQNAFYRNVAANGAGEKPKLDLVFVETVAPYRWKIAEFDVDFNAIGNCEFTTFLSLYNKCTESGDWSDKSEVEILLEPSKRLLYSQEEDQDQAEAEYEETENNEETETIQ